MLQLVSEHPAVSDPLLQGAGCENLVPKFGKRGDLGRWKLPGSMTCILYLQLDTDLTKFSPFTHSQRRNTRLKPFHREITRKHHVEHRGQSEG